MFVARYSKSPDSDESREGFKNTAQHFLGSKATIEFIGGQVSFAQLGHHSHANSGDSRRVIATGVAFRYAGTDITAGELCTQIRQFFDADGPACFGRLNAHFAAAILPQGNDTLYVARDHLGIEPLYYCETPTQVVFSSSARLVAEFVHDGAPELDNSAIGRFLCFNYNPGQNTFWRGVRKFPAAHYATLSEGRLELVRYWHLSYANQFQDDESAIAEKLRVDIRRAILSRAEGLVRPGVFVSGGLDSSTVLGVLAKNSNEKIHTFSYRCRGQGFDESTYSRLMAESVMSDHVEVEYTPESIDIMRELVEHMNEPFCDLGINVATGILGRAAAGVTSIVFTGDGGDELFGSHPIYEADKFARVTDKLPSVVIRPLASILAMLPDSDQKKNLVVKLKRFGESLRYPRKLRTHRWRLYYMLEDIERLIRKDFAETIDIGTLFDDVVESYEGADSAGLLEQTLYSDYKTIVDFYLRRNDLNRHLGIETRYPLLDFELVELCARIPSKLKTTGWFNTKHIMKKAIEPWLPHQIVYRKDKLGHSIPLKNWLRDNSHVRQFVRELLDEDRISRRGIIDPRMIKKQWEDHMELRSNNSHRLWALAVLELWLDAHVGTA